VGDFIALELGVCVPLRDIVWTVVPIGIVLNVDILKDQTPQSLKSQKIKILKI
jgi:hypothetical protein